MLIKIWLKDSGKDLPLDIWQGVRVLSLEWLAANGIRLDVEGDGSDLRQIIRSRNDLFSYYEKF
jgi:hypothetical protein